MITFTQGNILESTAKIITIPVNCVGVPGAGLAKTWADQYPNYVKSYKEKCGKTLYIGKPIILNSVIDCEDKKYAPCDFLMFPTKDHWKDQTKLSWIARGLQEYREIRDRCFPYEWKAAWPKIGCGLGGLEWDSVLPLMIHYLDHKEFEDVIYE